MLTAGHLILLERQFFQRRFDSSHDFMSGLTSRSRGMRHKTAAPLSFALGEGKHDMTKAECLAIESAARAAVGRAFNCTPKSYNISFPNSGASHEFDVYVAGLVIGGVSTSPLTTGGGNRNTGGCDRACSELLWLVLWPGNETRVHVLTDRALADWLVKRYQGIPFPHPITIYYYELALDALAEVGILRA